MPGYDHEVNTPMSEEEFTSSQNLDNSEGFYTIMFYEED